MYICHSYPCDYWTWVSLMCIREIFLGKTCSCVWLGGIAKISKCGVLVGHQIHADNLFPEITVVGVSVEGNTSKYDLRELISIFTGITVAEIKPCFYMAQRNIYSYLLLWCITFRSCELFMLFYNCIIFNFFVTSGSCNFNHTQTLTILSLRDPHAASSSWQSWGWDVAHLTTPVDLVWRCFRPKLTGHSKGVRRRVHMAVFCGTDRGTATLCNVWEDWLAMPRQEHHANMTVVFRI